MRLSTRVLYLLMLIVFLLFACSSEPKDEIVADASQVPDEVFTDFVTQESDSGLMLWKLTAPRANRFNKKKLVVLERPQIEFFNSEGQRQTTLVSDSGTYFEDRQDMLAYGNVIVKSIDGDVLETDSLLWVNGQDKIVSNSFVKLTRGNDVITGYGLECDPGLNSVDIKRNVKATIVDETGEIR